MLNASVLQVRKTVFRQAGAETASMPIMRSKCSVLGSQLKNAQCERVSLDVQDGEINSIALAGNGVAVSGALGL